MYPGLRICCFLLLALSLPTAAYQLHFIPAKITSPNYVVDVNALAQSATGEVHIEMVLTSTSDLDVLIDPSAIELVTQEGWRSPLINTEVELDNKIPANTKKYFSLKFQPINSMALYQLLKIQGDLKQQYTLSVPLLNEGKQPLSVSLAATDKAYRHYLQQAGQERSLYLHLPEIDADNFVATQSAHMKKHFTAEYPESASIVALAQQIVVNGLVFQWRAYQRDGKLAISLHFVNHNRQDVILDANQLVVELGNKKYLPSNDFSSLPDFLQADVVVNTNSRQYRVKPGGRFSWVFNYGTPLGAEPLSLSMNGVRVADKPFFAQPLRFTLAPGVME